MSAISVVALRSVIVDKVKPVVWVIIGFVLGCLFVWAVQNFVM